MQVAHPESFVTHAVIGGEQTIDFGISQDASFLFMLSSNLYKNQKLAVVREVMCNAWDAHIASGIQEPILVTLSGTHLSIQDFGTGIAKDMIGSIYGTYGKSTKQNDGKQTGGFGLGCKSPFAYTDHFEVTSCCNGEKTIYTMSKSSNEVGGKPGITPIVSMPTTETGITVRIPIKMADYGVFDQHVKDVAFQGGIPAMFNQEPLRIIPYTGDMDFVFVNNDERMSVRTYVRYGNVLYPVTEHSEYQEALNTVNAYKRALGNTRYGSNHYSLVLLAPPHSISITPSREEMSMTSQTISTIKLMLEAMVNKLNDASNRILSKLHPELLQKYVNDKNIGALVYEGYRLVHNNEALDQVTFVSKAEDVVRINAVNVSYLYTKKDFKNRMYALLSLGHGSRVDIQTYTNYALKYGKTNTKWFTRQVATPLLLAIKDNPSMSESRMYIRDSYSSGGGYSDRYIHLLRRAKIHADFAIKYLKKQVVITARRIEHVKNNPSGKQWQNGYFVYVISPNEKQYQAAMAFFQARPEFEIHDDYAITRVEPKTTSLTTRKPRRKGHALLSACVVDGKLDLLKSKEFETATIADPEAFVLHRVKKNSYANRAEIPGMSRQLSLLLAIQFGKKVVVVNTTSEASKLEKKGVLNCTEYFAQKLSNLYHSTPQFKQANSCSVGNWGDLYSEQRALANFILDRGLIKKIYPTVKLTNDEQQQWELIRHANVSNEIGSLATMRKLKEEINACGPNRDVKRAIGLVTKHPYLKAVDAAELMELLTSPKPQISRKAYVFLESICNY